jgi:hypothetical protein
LLALPRFASRVFCIFALFPYESRRFGASANEAKRGILRRNESVAAGAMPTTPPPFEPVANRMPSRTILTLHAVRDFCTAFHSPLIKKLLCNPPHLRAT